MNRKTNIFTHTDNIFVAPQVTVVQSGLRCLSFGTGPVDYPEKTCMHSITLSSNMAIYSDLLCAQQVGICNHNTDNAHIDKHSGTISVILAGHCLWLPDDGSCVKRNMLEQLLHFLMCF